MSGLIPEPMNCYDDYRLLHYGIGFTNIVARCTKGSADLTRSVYVNLVDTSIDDKQMIGMKCSPYMFVLFSHAFGVIMGYQLTCTELTLLLL
jgi:hypothetical protein